MIVTEVRPAVVATKIASIPNFPQRLRRLWRIQVVYPDVGSRPFINAYGFLRYPGEQPLQASPQELAFLRTLTTIYEET